MDDSASPVDADLLPWCSTIVERPTALDVHKAQVTACVRVPDKRGRREQHVQEFPTTVRGLLALRDWLAGHAVQQVVMEATGVHWKAPWAIAIRYGIGITLVGLANARDGFIYDGNGMPRWKGSGSGHHDVPRDWYGGPDAIRATSPSNGLEPEIDYRRRHAQRGDPARSGAASARTARHGEDGRGADPQPRVVGGSRY